jgi:GT2 family glycosyltransferase
MSLTSRVLGQQVAEIGGRALGGRDPQEHAAQRRRGRRGGQRAVAALSDFDNLAGGSATSTSLADALADGMLTALSAPIPAQQPGTPRPTVSLVICVWNRKDDLRDNLRACLAQTIAADEIIVVDNCSKDGTPEMVRAEFPAVKLIAMPHSNYGACETFNIGFASAKGEFVGILDDDVVLPPTWTADMLAEFAREPATTAILSPKVVEPQMPDWYKASAAVNTPRYMSTFRGCASLARHAAIRQCGYYDVRFYIFGNERDLTTRLLNRGYRVKMVPAIEVFHKAPFGMRHGKRSLYYHVRNFWLWAFKYVPWSQVLAFPFKFLRKGLGGKSKRAGGEVADAVGTIGLFENIKSVPWGYWICLKATLAALWNLPYCLARREVCRHGDFELPVK